MSSLRKVCLMCAGLIVIVLLNSCAELSQDPNLSSKRLVTLGPLFIQVPLGWESIPGDKAGEMETTGEGVIKSAKQETGKILLEKNDQQFRAVIVSQKVSINSDVEPIELLRAYGRIGIKKYMQVGDIQTKYNENRTIAGQPAVQYLLKTHEGKEIISFVRYKEILFIFQVNGFSDTIDLENTALLEAVKFGAAPAPPVSPARKHTATITPIRYTISPHISGLHLGDLRQLQLNFDEEYFRRVDISKKVDLLEQLCFVTAFLRVEGLNKTRDEKGFQAMKDEVHKLYLINADNLPLARCEALALFLDNKFFKSFALFDQLRKNHKNDLHTKLYLAMVRPYNGKESNQGISEVLQSDSKMVLGVYLKSRNLLAQGKEQEGRDLLKKISGRHPDNLWLNYAITRHDANPKSINRAEKKYLQIIQEDPSFFGARFNLALLYYQYNQDTEALRQLDTILARYPGDSASYLLKGLIYKRRNEARSARKQFEFAVNTDPSNFKALYNLGAICASRLDDPQCARSAFRKFIHIAPQNNRNESINNWLRVN